VRTDGPRRWVREDLVRGEGSRWGADEGPDEEGRADDSRREGGGEKEGGS
jgi:hypothetical protein